MKYSKNAYQASPQSSPGDEPGTSSGGREYTEKQLQLIEQLASLYMPPTEIAISMGVPELELKADINSIGHKARTAYLKGKISQKIEIRKQMAMLARVGSPAALEMSEKALLDMEDDE